MFVDWPVFQSTLTAWVVQFSDLPNHLLEFEGHMSEIDRRAMHTIIMAFFL